MKKKNVIDEARESCNFSEAEVEMIRTLVERRKHAN